MMTPDKFLQASWAQRYLMYQEVRECWWTKEKETLQAHIAALFELPSYTAQKGIQYDQSLFNGGRQ